MRIGLLSDTHGFLDTGIADVFRDVDEIWHAGDIGNTTVTDQLKTQKPLVAVYGNIDGRELRLDFPEHVCVQREGVTILMTHIGGYPGRYAPKARKLIEQFRPDIFICGHSHILKVMRDTQYNLLAMNPGAAGIHGFHKVKTVLRLTLHNGKVEHLEAVELGKRGALENS